MISYEEWAALYNHEELFQLLPITVIMSVPPLCFYLKNQVWGGRTRQAPPGYAPEKIGVPTLTSKLLKQMNLCLCTNNRRETTSGASAGRYESA